MTAVVGAPVEGVIAAHLRHDIGQGKEERMVAERQTQPQMLVGVRHRVGEGALATEGVDPFGAAARQHEVVHHHDPRAGPVEDVQSREQRREELRPPPARS